MPISFFQHLMVGPLFLPAAAALLIFRAASNTVAIRIYFCLLYI
jgi:hypothetical protein